MKISLSRALTDSAASIPALATEVHNSLMISAMHLVVRNCISPIIVGWTDGKIVLFLSAQEARERPCRHSHWQRCIAKISRA
jgi:hypothetical protein